MSRSVLAPLAVALSAVLVFSQIQAEPTAPLFVVEQQRSALVTRLAKQWSDAFAVLPKERRLDHEQLSSALWALRADRLFAVTLAGEVEAIEAVLGEGRRDALKPRVSAKALGDATADLTYTPINPCRILDTRSTVVGPLAPNVARTFDGYSTNFATQGGTGSGCGIPNGVAALAMNVYAVNPTNLGFIKVWPANGIEPDVSTVNYQVGLTAIATGTLVPVDAASSNQFTAKSPATVDFIADVVGYFKPPGDATSLDIKVAGQRVMRYEYNAISPNVIGGSPANNATVGVRGATIAGGGVASGNSDPELNWEAPNRVTNHYGTVGGYANRAGNDAVLLFDAAFATVGGGLGNTASGNWSTIGGGFQNLASADGSAVRGGSNNIAAGKMSTSGGGEYNAAGGEASTVGGGLNNTASGNWSTIGGGMQNTASGYNNAIGGGLLNAASGNYSTVGGGMSNAASADYSVIAGGLENTATGGGSAIGGGSQNSAASAGSTIAGGSGNTSSGFLSTIGGGATNVASSFFSTVAGGGGNAASGHGSFVGGGGQNAATGSASTICGGERNIASGDFSFAAGRQAKTQTASGNPTAHDGAFVWADSSPFDFNSAASNELSARATGGVRFVTAIDGTGVPTWTCGVSGGAGGSWGCSSDRNLKTDLIPLDGIGTLERLSALPVYQWVARGDPRRTQHAGPTAQDFMAAFGLGDNDRMIGFADAQGVAFAAIQGLNAKLEARLAEKDREIAELKHAFESLLARMPSEGRPIDRR